MMPWVAAVKSGLVAELLGSAEGQAWRTSNKAFPLSLTCRQTDNSLHVRWERRPTRQTGECETGGYLCVAGSDLLVQLLVLLDSSFQLCCRRWQRPFRTGLNPTLHFDQELPRQTDR